jgi:steroid delta-isomerase-like uncharacterized protein
MAPDSELKARVREAWHEAWDKGNVDALDGLLADDFSRVTHGSGTPLSATAYKEQIVATRRAFPDLTTSIDDIVQDGDQLAIFWTSTGTHRDELLGIPTTNRTVTTFGTNLCTIVDGRVSHESVTWDTGHLLTALGISALGSTTVRDEATPATLASPVVGEPDPELLKGFNRQFVTGVTVVSTMDGEKARGLAVNAYCSISLDPPLVMVCIQRTSSTWPALFAATHLGVNVLGRGQRQVVSVFSSKDPDKFARIDWRPGPHGSPLITGSAAMLEAEIQERFQAKTHTIFVCRVRHAEVDAEEPMVYKAGKFFDGGNLTELPAD